MDTYIHIVCLDSQIWARNFFQVDNFPIKKITSKFAPEVFSHCKMCWACFTWKCLCLTCHLLHVSPAVRPRLHLFTGFRHPQSISFFPGAEAKCFSPTGCNCKSFLVSTRLFSAALRSSSRSVAVWPSDLCWPRRSSRLLMKSPGGGEAWGGLVVIVFLYPFYWWTFMWQN